MRHSWQVVFWGVRGSSPQSGPHYSEVGGHTSCVSVLIDDNLYVFDAGTGIINCGQWVLSQQDRIKKIFLFLSHVHLDHILGLPFFAPLWLKDIPTHIFSSHLQSYGGIFTVLSRIFTPPYCPLPWDNLPRHVKFVDLIIGQDVYLTDHISLRTISLNHPNEATGYRLCGKDISLAYLTDLSHAQGFEALVPFVKDIDLLIYDATFTEEEFEARPHWGHSTWRAGIDLAMKSKAQRLAFFHHDPFHTDAFIKEIETKAQEVFKGAFVAKQDMELMLVPI